MALSGGPFVIWGTGMPPGEFRHVDDLADACVFLITRYLDDGRVNVGSGEHIEMIEPARLVCDVVGFGGEITHPMSEPDGTPRKLIRGESWPP